MAAVQNNVHELGDFRAMPVDAWTNLYAKFADKPWSTVKTSESPAAKADDVFGTPMGANSEESPFLVEEDPIGTPQGPNLTPGKPLGFLTSGTPSPTKALAKVRDAFLAAVSPRKGKSEGAAEFEIADDSNVPMLEAVEPVFAGEIPEAVVSPTGSGSPTSKSEGAAGTWKRLSASLPTTQAIRDNMNPAPVARQLSEKALKTKEQVSESVNKAKEAIRDNINPARQLSEKALKVPAQVSETAQKGMGFVKEQTETVRKVGPQLSETAQKSFGYAKEKAGNARDKAQTVSAAVTAKVTQTTQKGMDIARGMRPQAQGKVGGA